MDDVSDPPNWAPKWPAMDRDRGYTNLRERINWTRQGFLGRRIRRNGLVWERDATGMVSFSALRQGGGGAQVQGRLTMLARADMGPV